MATAFVRQLTTVTGYAFATLDEMTLTIFELNNIYSDLYFEKKYQKLFGRTRAILNVFSTVDFAAKKAEQTERIQFPRPRALLFSRFQPVLAKTKEIANNKAEHARLEAHALLKITAFSG